MAHDLLKFTHPLDRCSHSFHQILRWLSDSANPGRATRAILVRDCMEVKIMAAFHIGEASIVKIMKIGGFYR